MTGEPAVETVLLGGYAIVLVSMAFGLDRTTRRGGVDDPSPQSVATRSPRDIALVTMAALFLLLAALLHPRDLPALGPVLIGWAVVARTIADRSGRARPALRRSRHRAGRLLSNRQSG
ncbi:hypothetical protein [Nocardia sp. alder85J]|uniref:hypothetical protein n=1 Tax=Nocardia sp. alder85J TaxID=2862949 RepID=UPI001CD1CD03|nr:hypothetical protein [Nocardia sp. alder85J]MCX4090821.1 hypothetical protein [Nocardia sp. alder85J]